MSIVTLLKITFVLLYAYRKKLGESITEEIVIRGRDDHNPKITSTTV